MLSGCNLFSKKGDNIEKEVVARAGSNYLYYADIADLFDKYTSKEDCLAIRKRYAEQWIREQLLMEKATDAVAMDENMEKKLLDYKNSLLIHEFNKKILKEKLDTVISNAEIEKYYNANAARFVLKQNIIRGAFIKISKEAPILEKIPGLLNSTLPKDLVELHNYCIQFASTFSLEDTLWLDFEELVNKTPLEAASGNMHFFDNKDYIKMSDDSFLYFLKIKEYKTTDQISPIAFIRPEIKNILLNKRKIKLINELEDDIYTEAKNKKYFEIY